MAVIEQGDGLAVAVLNRNKPVFYCVPADTYAALLNKEIEMKNLLYVAESILDSAAIEYAGENLESVKSVQVYAENRCDITLSDSEAEKVLAACKAWVDGTESGELNGTNDYYYTVKKPLLGEGATL